MTTTLCPGERELCPGPEHFRECGGCSRVAEVICPHEGLPIYEHHADDGSRCECKAPNAEPIPVNMPFARLPMSAYDMGLAGPHAVHDENAKLSKPSAAAMRAASKVSPLSHDKPIAQAWITEASAIIDAEFRPAVEALKIAERLLNGEGFPPTNPVMVKILAALRQIQGYQP